MGVVRKGKGYMLAKDFMLQYVNVVAGELSNLICLMVLACIASCLG